MVRRRQALVSAATAMLLACAGSEEGVPPQGSKDAGSDSPAVISDSGVFPATDGGPCTQGAVGACYSGLPSHQNVGECKDGTTTCEGGKWGPCTGDTLPGVEVCNEKDDDCDGITDETCACVDGKSRSCYSGPSGTEGNGPCAGGTQNCTGGSWETLCIGEVTPGTESCNGIDDDCDGTKDDGNPGGGAKCSTGQPGVCSAGSMTCTGGKLSCEPVTPATAEKCNLLDDDCDDSCDEGAGCRVGVHRSWSGSIGAHLYTSNLSEAQSGGYTLEFQNYYYLYSASQPGMAKFYRCVKTNGKPFYTTSSACEGGGTNHSTLGYIGSGSTGCDSTPLYRLYASSSGNHFYTPSISERDYAVSIGYKYESIAGYVWKVP